MYSRLLQVKQSCTSDVSLSLTLNNRKFHAILGFIKSYSSCAQYTVEKISRGFEFSRDFSLFWVTFEPNFVMISFYRRKDCIRFVKYYFFSFEYSRIVKYVVTVYGAAFHSAVKWRLWFRNLKMVNFWILTFFCSSLLIRS